MTIQNRLKSSFIKYSNNIAVRSNGIILSYKELYEAALVISNDLQKRKIHNSGILLLYKDKLQLIIAILGVLFSQNIFIPTPTKTPEKRIKKIIDLSNCKIILTDNNDFAIEQVSIVNSTKLLISAPPIEFDPLMGDINDLSHIYFTSGSTGEPKGIKGRNGSLLSFMEWMIEKFNIDSKDNVLQLSNEGFSLFKREVLATLIAGATICIPNDMDKSSFTSISEFISKYNITIINVVPSYAKYLIKGLSIEKHQNLRLIFFAGEMLHKSLVEKYIYIFGKKCKLINLYGPTETTQAKFYFEIDFNNYYSTDIIPVGYPINTHTKAILRDENGMVFNKNNTKGEILIQTNDMSFGYCLSSENAPFIEIENNPVFCTGDIGFLDEKGLLYVFGRNDSQVKIRGMRVELGEIEAAISNIKSVKEAAVIYKQDTLGNNNQLIAFIVGDILREFLESELIHVLPDYMLPNQYVFLNSLPKNRNNKIERIKLNDLLINEAIKNKHLIDKNTKLITKDNDEIVSKLKAIWRTVINKDFTISDDFFAMGGSSLLVMSIAAQIQEQFKIKLSFATFFEKRTIEELANYIRQYSGDLSDTFSIKMEKGKYSSNSFPLSHVQQAYVLGRFGKFQLGNIATQRYIEYKFKNHLDIKRLEKAINHLIARHEMLRTTFSTEDIVHNIHSEFKYCLEVNHFKDSISFERGTLQTRKELLDYQFDITKLPLFKIIISRGIAEDRLHFLSDILIMDANSLNIFRNDLTSLYNNQVVTPVKYTFRDYIFAKNQAGENLLSKFYWMSRIKNLPNIQPVCTKINPDTIEKPIFKRDTQVISSEIWQKFKHKAIKYKVSPSSALLTIYYYVLSRYSENNDFLINLSIFDPIGLSKDLCNTIGDFTELVVFSPYKKTTDNFINQVEYNHGLLWHDLEHRDVDGLEAISIIKQKFDLDPHGILAPIVFTSLLEHSGQNEFFLENSKEVFYLSQTAQVWLDNNALESQGRLISGWDYVTQLFDEEFIIKLHVAYIGLVKYFALNTWDNVILDVIPKNDLELINNANRLTQGIDFKTTLKDRVLLTPNAIAIIDEYGKTSYRELLEKSYGIESILKKIDVQNGELVAIFSEKGYQQVVAALGIMKFGAAYLPLNIDWPIRRIEDVLSDGQVKTVLVSSKQFKKLSSHIKFANLNLVIIDNVEIENYTKINEISIADLNEMAYVLFTSGSTGKPKGVMVSYLGAVNTIKAVNQYFNVNENDVVLAISELNFDLSVYDIFGILYVGGTIVFPNQELANDPLHWYKLVLEHKVTIWNSVPQIMQLFIDFIVSQNKTIDTLRVVLLSGDWIPINLPKQILDLNQKIRVMSLGGATEGSIWSIWYEIYEIDPSWKSIPYGIAMPNQKIYVLNKMGEHCPVGVMGEIYIGGIGVAIGYWGDDEKTKGSFISHNKLGRLYKTGDFGKWNQNGYVEFLGRIDNQVKINGYRVELDEIIAKLNQIPGVKDAAVKVQSQNKHDYIIGYLVADNEKKFESNTIKIDMEEFKLAKHGIRFDQGDPTYKPNISLNKNKYKLRKSYRKFLSEVNLDLQLINSEIENTESIAFDFLNLTEQNCKKSNIDKNFIIDILKQISCIELNDRVLPKYLYPSAGSSYAVQCYLNIKTNIDEYKEGYYYYYNPIETSLIKANYLGKTNLDNEFSIDFIVNWQAIKPLYPDESRKFAFLEVGHMLALLINTAKTYQINFSLKLFEESLDENNSLLARLVFAQNSESSLSPKIILNKLIKVDERVFTDGKHHTVDLNQVSIFEQSNWYSGQLIESGQIILSIDGEECMENLIYAGMFFQIMGDRLYKHNIGSCMLGYKIYENVLYSMVMGGITLEDKTLSESRVSNKPIKYYIDKYISSNLPLYMMPYDYIAMDCLPLTSNGKVDIKKLPVLNIGLDKLNYVEPRNEYEIRLCEAFALELDCDVSSIGINDDFFRLGGNSILAIKLVSRINNIFDSNIKVSDIFELKSVSEIVRLIRSTLGNFIFKDFKIINTDTNNTYTPFELNNIQMAYYLGRFDNFELGNISTHSYNEFKFKFIDHKKLEFAINKLIQRHLGLRTIFKNGMQQYLEIFENYEVKFFEIFDEEKFLEVRSSLSHKIYQTDQFPLFDILVTKCNFDNQEPFYILHIGFDILLMDGNSTRIFYDELSALYLEPEKTFEPILVNYRDYALQVAKIRNSKLFIQDKEYWFKKLPEYNFEYNLPFKCRVTDVEHPHFTSISKAVPLEIWEQLKEKAITYNIGLTTIILTIYGKVLSKWSNQKQITINLTLFNRLPLHPQINSVLGDFTVLELFNFVDKQDRCNVIDEINLIQRKLWDDLDHNLFDGIDFQRMIRDEYGVESKKLIAPIVLTSILGIESEFNNQPFINSDFIENYFSSNQTSQTWLVNHAYTTKDGFVSKWDYVEELFDQNTIINMQDDYCSLISKLASTNWQIESFPKVDNTQSEIIESINTDKQNVPNINICDYVINHIYRQNLLNNVAVIDNSREKVTIYNYKHLLDSSLLLAKLIITQYSNYCASGLIAVLSEKGFNQVVATFAIMQSGNGYLPLNIAWPSNRIDEILFDSEVKLVLISNQQAGLLENTLLRDKYKFIIIDEFLNKLTNDQINSFDSILLPTVMPTDIAYVIFTSGSTGKPKGVTISHIGALNTIIAVNSKYNVCEKDRVFALSELSFDLSVYDIFSMLMVGGAIVFPNQNKTRDTKNWLELINQYKVSIWNSVPQLSALLINDVPDLISNSLRLFLLSGDWIDTALPGKLKEKFKKSVIVSLGGATEGSIWSIWHEINYVDQSWDKIPYGRAMPNQEIWILNHALENCPVGVRGDIYIGGLGVALNYYKNELQTNESFIIHSQYGRLYKTGDLGKVNHLGYIEFEGRIDNQVKLNGYRVELEEITFKIKQIEGIEDAITRVVNYENHNYLIAYLIIQTGSYLNNLNDEQIRESINGKLLKLLPKYMMPYIYMKIDYIPLTVNGKININLLRVPDFSSQSDNYKSPENELEDKLCQLFAKALNKDVLSIGVNDNFFLLGGDSIVAIRLIGTLNQVLNIQLSVKDIFVNSNISKLSNYISQNCGIKKIDYETKIYKPFELVDFTNYENFSDILLIEDIYPASHVQMGMIFESKLSKYKNYHVIVSTKVKAKFEEEKFLKIWNKLVDKHCLLRAKLLDSINTYDILIYKQIKIDYLVYFDSSVKELILKERQINFDFKKPGLFRLIINSNSIDFDLIFSFHHSIADGYSVDSLLNEFTKAYVLDIKLQPKVRLNYADFIKKEKSYISNKEQLKFWGNYLIDSNLPKINWKGENIETHDGLNYSRTKLDQNIIKNITKLSNELNVSIDSVFIYTYMVTISQFLNSKDITIGLVVNNRLEDDEGDRLFGLFINTIPFRLNDISKNIHEGIMSVYNEKVKLYEYKNFPFPKIKELYANEVYQFAFNFTKFKIENSEIASYNSDDFQRSNIPFMLNISQGEIFNLELVTHTDFCSQEYLDYFRIYLEHNLSALFDFGTFAKLIPKDFNLLVNVYNSTNTKYPDNMTIYELIYNQVQQHPNDIALIFNDIELNYLQLDEKVRELAIYLVNGYNIAAKDVIALCLDRSEYTVISILAAWFIGAVYVPIDPSYPQERINYILQDCKARAIITCVEFESLFKDIYENILSVDSHTFKTKSQKTNTYKFVSKINSNDLAYVLYTSGTTGKPKGVMIEHRSIINLATSMIKNHDLLENKVVAVYSNYVFDAFICELIPPLINGNQIILVDNEARLSIDLLCNFIVQKKVNIIFIPSVLVADFLSKVKFLKHELKIVFSGGNKLTGITEYIPENLTLINEYGPTESTVCTTLHKLSLNDISTNIGKPISNIKTYILDDNLQLVPFGVIGELYIGGAGLARGYLNNSILTNEKFISNPFQSEVEKKNNVNDKIFKTGDLVKYLASGELEFVGRNDSQVKIRGYRVELREIENAITTNNPEIQQVLVKLQKSNNLGQMAELIIAYYIAKVPVDEYKLKASISKLLPEYMLPHAYISLEKFPLNKNGKIQVDALPVPGCIKIDDIFVRPRTELEWRICNVWAEILQIDANSISIKNDFFSLGGNSLLATRLLSKLNNLFGINLTVTEILLAKTIERISIAINKNKGLKIISKLNDAFNKPLMFMIHPGHGGCEVYTKLANQLSKHYTCYGIDNFNLYSEYKYNDLNSLSNYYFNILEGDNLLPKDKTTPIALFGWSLGGVIALELSVILEKYVYSNIKVYLLDTVLYDEEMQKLSNDDNTEIHYSKVDGFQPTQSLETNYIEQVVNNYNIESSLISNGISDSLKMTNIFLFKAMQSGVNNNLKINEEIIKYTIGLPYNNINKIVKNLIQIQVFKLDNSNHWNIIDDQNIIKNIT